MSCRHCRPFDMLTPGRLPAWHCRRCGCHMGQRRTHHVVGGRRYVLCAGCYRTGLAALYPDCPRRRHDRCGHAKSGERTNRAGAWRLLLDGYDGGVSP